MSRRMVHFGSSKDSSHVREAADVMIYISVWDATEAGLKIYEAENGVFCIEGPVMPDLFKGVGSTKMNEWSWEWWDGYVPRTGNRLDNDPELTVTRKLQKEANERLRGLGQEPIWDESVKRPASSDAAESHNKRQRPNAEIDYDAGEMRDIPVERDSLDRSKHFGDEDIEFMSAESPRYTSDDLTSAWEEHVLTTEAPKPSSNPAYVTRADTEPQYLDAIK